MENYYQASNQESIGREMDMQITPTLNFGGTCREAIQMYEKALDGEITR